MMVDLYGKKPKKKKRKEKSNTNLNKIKDLVFDDNDDYYYYNNYLFIYIVTFQDTLSSSQLINFVLLKKKQDNYRSDWIARSFQIAFFCSYK